MRLLKNKEYNELKTAKEYWLLPLKLEDLVRAAPEVDKWFKNLILLELNSIIENWNKVTDEKAGARLRMLWEISGTFKTTFINKIPEKAIDKL